MALSTEEIKKRLQRLSNLEYLHAQQGTQLTRQREQNTELKAEITRLQALVAEQSTIIETLRLHLEEVKQMVFKKKQQQDESEESVHTRSDAPQKERDSGSYTRALPKDEDITHTEHHRINECPSCHGQLQEKEARTHYVEDIVLPNEHHTFKEVTRYIYERGWCPECRRWYSALPPPRTPVALGPNLRSYVAYATIILRLSYSQIQQTLNDFYRLSLSEGEITTILTKEARLLRPEFEALTERIRSQKGVHYDESSWPVQKEGQGQYLWAATGTETTDTVFLFGRSRGKGVAEELRGTQCARHVGISDGYGAYTNLFEQHQLCWAHIHRKFRDLAYSGVLTPQTRAHCLESYQALSSVYADLRAQLAQPWNAQENETVRTHLRARLLALTTPHEADPAKLAALKRHLQIHREKYFTCLLHEGIPPDNNKAERVLRHMVIKRRTSFGSRTQKGADVLSVLASVMLSLWWKKPQFFFGEYGALRGV